jgi:hypothetical protein
MRGTGPPPFWLWFGAVSGILFFFLVIHPWIERITNGGVR